MKKFEFFFKNILLKILLIISTLSGKKQSNNEVFSKILFIRLNRIGDALVTTPLLHLIKQNLNCKSYILADNKNHIVYDNNYDIDRIIIFNKGIKGFLEVIKYIKKEGIQTIVDLHDDVSTTVSFLIALSGVKNKFGLEKENKTIYTKTVRRLDPANSHVVVRLLEILKLFDIEPDLNNAKIYFNIDAADKKITNDFIHKNFAKNKKIIGINISSGSKARFWGISRFRKLLEYLQKYDVNLLLLSSPEDIKLAERISNGTVKIFFSKRFNEFAAMICNLNLLITPDTAAVHLAAAYEVPVFGIYVKYKTNNTIWSPYRTTFECVITEEPDLKNVTFDEVKQKLEPFLSKIIIRDFNDNLSKK